MARAVSMPKLGQSEESATIVQWHKREGDAVVKGDILFEIETDKALLEVESFFEGTLLKILAREGETVPVQAVVGYIGQPGEPIPETPSLPGLSGAQAPVALPTIGSPQAMAPSQQGPSPRRAAQMAPTVPTLQPSIQPPPVPPRMPTGVLGRFRITPRAARLARESGVDPRQIQGTGPDGRVLEKDVKAYLVAQGYDRLAITPAARKLALKWKLDLLTLRDKGESQRITVEDVRNALAERPQAMTRMRQIIAERLTRSYTTTPHFFTTISVDMSDLVEYRLQLKSQGLLYTVTDFLIKAVALTLKEFPAVNSATDGKSAWWHSRVHVGMAVALDEGLVVPVIRDADRLTLAEIHERATELTAKARAGKLTPQEMSGSTFTLSNMGMLDVENFTAIINPGEGAILAVSSILKKPAVLDDKVTIRSLMKMTLAADHRLIDGATAAKFLNGVKRRLEETSLWKRFV
jgi:pyruvate dehydrogenase E2 component (dihydrolipoamide acetyltransferase)